MSFHNGKFGKLTIRREIAPDVFECDCQCGNGVSVWRSLLANGVQIDCGLCVLRPARNGQLRKPYNGYGHWGHTRYYWTRSGKRKMRGSGEFFSWQSMIGRCYCKGHAAYEFYGARGIRVCERWLPDGKGLAFKNFIDDMGPRPSAKTLDRSNPQGHYEPTNCKWSDAKEQAHNQRHVLFNRGDLPKIEGVRAMEKRIDDWALEETVY
jgi:hypothetical protein